MSSTLTKTVVPLLVVGAGIGAAVLLASAREVPSRESKRAPAPLVSVDTVWSAEIPVTVRGQGTVRPRERIQLMPQVSGKVLAVHRSFVEGGSVRRGETLVRIDPVDYELRVRRAEAEVARAEVRLQTEQAEAKLAREEWGRLRPDQEPDPLAARVPQVRLAKAEVDATRASLEEARLALSRTTLTAPWDAKVESESVDPGQFLVAGQPIATLRGLKTLEIPVPLEDRDLAWFDPPGTRATVTVPFAGQEWSYDGEVVRIAGVDPRSRMVHVIVEVTDPGDSDRPPLEPGLFAEVEIEGRSVTASAIPRTALHDRSVWIVDEDSNLRVRPVEVARTTREIALITSGLTDGDRIVVTSLEAVTEGMPVRLSSAERTDSTSAETTTPTEDASPVGATATDSFGTDSTETDVAGTDVAGSEGDRS